MKTLAKGGNRVAVAKGGQRQWMNKNKSTSPLPAVAAAFGRSALAGWTGAPPRSGRSGGGLQDNAWRLMGGFFGASGAV